MDKSSLIEKGRKVNCTFEEFNSLISKEISQEARSLLFTKEVSQKKDNQFNNTMQNLSNSYIVNRSFQYSNSSNSFKRGKFHNTPYNNHPIAHQPNSIASSASFSYLHIGKMVNEGIKLKDAFIPCKIANLDGVNALLNFSIESPLWYINHNDSNKGTSYGPFSTKEIKSMYTEQRIDGETRIRPIDVFEAKSGEGFGFIDMKAIDNPNFFVEGYKVNKDMITLIDSFKKLKPIDEPIEVKRDKINEQLKPIAAVSESTVTKQSIVASPMKIEESTKKEIGISIQNEASKQENSLKTKEILIEEKDNEKEVASQQAPTQLHNKKKKGKGPKVKPVNLDVKVGFYTMSHQDKNYSPMYICGQSDQISNVPKVN